MRIFNVFCLTLTAFVTLIASVSANPYDEMAKVQAAMAHVHSYESVATWSAGSKSTTARIEAVAPDRFRSVLFGGNLQFIVTGSQYWVKTSRQPWTKLKRPPVMSLVGNLEAVNHFSDSRTYDIRDLGMRGGYRAFAVNEKHGQSQNIVYVRPDHLVSHVEIRAGTNRGSITYGQYNAPISIQPPGR